LSLGPYLLIYLVVISITSLDLKTIENRRRSGIHATPGSCTRYLPGRQRQRGGGREGKISPDPFFSGLAQSRSRGSRRRLSLGVSFLFPMRFSFRFSCAPDNNQKESDQESQKAIPEQGFAVNISSCYMYETPLKRPRLFAFGSVFEFAFPVTTRSRSSPRSLAHCVTALGILSRTA